MNTESDKQNNSSKRILIFFTSVGLGHKIIAENIGWHLQQAGYTVKLADILQVQSGKLVDFGTWLHQLVNKHFPFIWKFLYNSKIFSKLTMPLRVPMAGKNSGRAAEVIVEFKPDLIISTQTTSSAIVSYLKRNKIYQGKFAIAFSDYHFHPYWVYPEADFYLANIEEQKKVMVTVQGIDPNKIAVTGVTLQPHKITATPQQIREQLNIALTDKVVLVASGSLGTGVQPSWYQQFAAELGKAQPNSKILIVCGKNEQLREALTEKLAGNLNTQVFGFYSPMQDLYSIADIFVTKPGGLSVAESLSWNLPLAITHWLPGQEELNYNYLWDRELIMPIALPVKLGQLVQSISDELQAGAFRKKLQQNSIKQELIGENRLGQAIIQNVSQILK